MPGSDLDLATDLARKVELKFGFGDLGPLFLADGPYDPLVTVPGLLASVGKRIESAMADAGELLGKNRAALEAVADALERSGYLSPAEVAELVSIASQAGSLGNSTQEPGNEMGASLQVVRQQLEARLANEIDQERGDAGEPSRNGNFDDARQPGDDCSG